MNCSKGKHWGGEGFRIRRKGVEEWLRFRKEKERNGGDCYGDEVHGVMGGMKGSLK